MEASPFSGNCGFKTADARNCRGSHDFNAEGLFQNEQVFVLGNDRLGGARKSARQKRVVVRISAALLA